MSDDSDNLVKRLRERNLAFDDNFMLEAADEIERLERELAGVRKDAARYRWLRSIPTDAESLEASGYKLPFIATYAEQASLEAGWPKWSRTVGEDADAAIDAAMAAQTKPSS